MFALITGLDLVSGLRFVIKIEVCLALLRVTVWIQVILHVMVLVRVKIKLMYRVLVRVRFY